MVEILIPDREGIERAADCLLEGGLVAFPTETVYGLGALAGDDKAAARIFVAKGRPSHNPLIVHVPGRAHAAAFAEFDDRADRLVEAFWPGALTLVLPLKLRYPVSRLVTAGLASVAVRMPRHPVALAILEKVGLPVAAPSANRSGRVSATRAADVVAELGDRVDLIVDGGTCPIGVESTVVDLTDPERIAILRPGGVTREAIEAVVGAVETLSGGGAAPRSPGMLERHYAPGKPLRLDAETVAEDELLLAFGPDVPERTAAVRNLSPTGDLDEAAGNLFRMMRELDGMEGAAIAVMPIPRHGLGEALNDRLARAAKAGSLGSNAA